MAYDPWEGVPDGWSVDWVQLPVRGRCHWGTRTILLRISLSEVRARCVLAHEIVHAERGTAPAWARAREEAVVSAEAARRLISLDALAEALAWSLSLSEVAEELAVDRPTLEALLGDLTPQEVEELTRRLRHHFGG
uniref:IrrE N-terminal-like domain-containing protein n=1 Tax=Dulem virus 32 TaxID=3145750 RepID=A0AAU8B0J8_9CAUD